MCLCLSVKLAGKLLPSFAYFAASKHEVKIDANVIKIKAKEYLLIFGQIVVPLLHVFDCLPCLLRVMNKAFVQHARYMAANGVEMTSFSLAVCRCFDCCRVAVLVQMDFYAAVIRFVRYFALFSRERGAVMLDDDSSVAVLRSKDGLFLPGAARVKNGVETFFAASHRLRHGTAVQKCLVAGDWS